MSTPSLTLPVRRLALPDAGALAALVLLAWAVTAAVLAARGWATTAETLNDTDDAMRLVAVRALLEGRGWFDVHEPRVLPGGYDGHWSRLIDGGIAGLILGLRTVFDPSLAERLARVVWPLLWLLPAMAATVAMAHRLAGRDGALVGLVLAVQALPAYQQFVPGRIDHHNVQIALVLLALAAAVWSDRVRWAGAAAGGASALGLAVGLEGLPFLAVAGAALALRFAADPRAAGALRDYGAALAAGAALALATGIAPVRAAPLACDALAWNGGTAVMLGGAGLVLASYARTRSALVRTGAIALAAGAALAVGVALDPRCLGGPFALVDPLVRAQWLVRVAEMQPLQGVVRDDPEVGLAYAAFLLVATLAVAVLARHRRDAAFWTLAAAFGLAAVLSLSTIKTTSYATWLGMPLVAALVLALTRRLGRDTLLARVGLALLLSPGLLALTAAQAGRALAPGSAGGPDKACFRTASYGDLAALSPGIVAAHADFGPFLLAHTPHRVLGAPYHRLDRHIATLQALFAAPPEEARALLAASGATHLAVCAGQQPEGDRASRTSLAWRLAEGDVPAWLEPLPTTAGRPFAIYRIHR